MNTLSKKDVQKVASRLPAAVKDVLARRPGEVFLAGGFIASVLIGEEPKDIDLFCSDAARSDVVDEIHQVGMPLRAVTQKALTFAAKDDRDTIEGLEDLTTSYKPVQLVTYLDFRTAESVHKFDFAHCMAAVWDEGDADELELKSYCTPLFLSAIINRSLILTEGARTDSLCSISRALRFAERGWCLHPEVLGDLVYMCSEYIKHRGLTASEVIKEVAGGES